MDYVLDILTFIILYNNLIPISLIVTMEVVKFQQAQLINSDLDMYYARTDTPALCRTSSLVEELGQIEYVFSDKTGTLTCNEMEFRAASIAGTAYSETVDENKRGENGEAQGWKTFNEMRAILDGPGSPFDNETSERAQLREFLTLLAVCHTVIPEVVDGKTIFQASSPDEAALVAGAETLGYQFYVRRLSYRIAKICLTACELRLGNLVPYMSKSEEKLKSLIYLIFANSTQRANGCQPLFERQAVRSSCTAKEQTLSFWKGLPKTKSTLKKR